MNTILSELDWDDLGALLDAHGFAVTDPLLSAGECGELAAWACATA
jgi:hypothetical protein